MRRRIRVVAAYQFTVGTAVVAWWLVMLPAGAVPQVAAGDRAIWFHVVAEGLMAGLLIMGGLLLWRDHRRARMTSALALGSLLYSSVNSAGYFVDKGEWAMVGMFGVLMTVTVWMVWSIFDLSTSHPGT